MDIQIFYNYMVNRFCRLHLEVGEGSPPDISIDKDEFDAYIKDIFKYFTTYSSHTYPNQNKILIKTIEETIDGYQKTEG